MPVSSTVPIPLNTAALLELRYALVIAWVEVLATTVSALAIRATRVRIAPLLLN